MLILPMLILFIPILILFIFVNKAWVRWIAGLTMCFLYWFFIVRGTKIHSEANDLAVQYLYEYRRTNELSDIEKYTKAVDSVLKSRGSVAFSMSAQEIVEYTLSVAERERKPLSFHDVVTTAVIKELSIRHQRLGRLQIASIVSAIASVIPEDL